MGQTVEAGLSGSRAMFSKQQFGADQVQRKRVRVSDIKTFDVDLMETIKCDSSSINPSFWVIHLPLSPSPGSVPFRAVSSGWASSGSSLGPSSGGCRQRRTSYPLKSPALTLRLCRGGCSISRCVCEWYWPIFHVCILLCCLYCKWGAPAPVSH